MKIIYLYMIFMYELTVLLDASEMAGSGVYRASYFHS